ncbi:MAG: xanthine dehydrogenase family protein molybdopterin-binding subunit, partial [Phycisphaerales bacterium]
TDDLPAADFPGGLLWWGMTVRSPVPRGLIRAITFDPSVDWSALTVVTAKDLPGPNITYLIEHDQPVLADREVRHVHEPIVLIAGPDRRAVRRAVRAVKVEIDPLPAALAFRVEPRSGEVQHGPDNALKRIALDKGDVDAAFRTAAHIVEGVYETGAQEHVYIEPQSMIAYLDAAGVLCVKGSMQCPYYVLNALKHALARDESALRVIHAPTGGGFGGKEDYPSTLALHAALLALKSGKPVKMVYDRDEDMAATTKRHPSRIRCRTGFDAAGRLVAQDIDILLDGGAYVTLSPVVLSRALIHAAGPYHSPNVRIRALARLTNAVPFGAFRGFGAPQSQFAGERHMDRAARQIGIDPLELRRINLLRDGETTATGQIIGGGTDRLALLDEAATAANLHTRRKEHAAFNSAHPYLRRGLGISAAFHGAGFTGNGELHLRSRLRLESLPDGRVLILSANTEMGQGATTIFTGIAAERLQFDPAHVLIAEPDTSRVPNSGPTVASRTAMVVGRLVERACDRLRALFDDATGPDLAARIIDWHRPRLGQRLLVEVEYEHPPGLTFDEKSYVGDAYATFSYAVCVADVEVDLRTGRTILRDFVSAQEIGRVIHPTLARGQVQGGVVQAIGWALTEECVTRAGAMANNQLTNYIIPTSADVPPIRTVFHENPYPRGGGGAKGVGELPMDAPAPAILSAIADATAADPCSIPMTPERLLPLLPEASLVPRQPATGATP